MPRIAVLSDIHGNLPALEKVLNILDSEAPDEWLCLGDIVGYGPFPAECIQLLMERKIPTVLGNHDAGVSGKLNLNHFREPNRSLIKKSMEMLNADQLNWLKNLPLVIDHTDYIAAHATIEYPQNWKYVESAFIAREMLKKIDKHICFVGHTHRPAIVSEKIGLSKYQKDGKFLINPGSVGQSRDGDYRASCCLIDTENEVYKSMRVEYNIEKALTGLMKIGYSRKLANQLIKV